MSKRFMDEDMVAHRGNQQVHVAKKQQRNSALEIVFDPASHKEYITGFRKRKQQRRKEALTSLEKKQRQQRIEERADRRQVLRDKLHLEKYEHVGEDDDGLAVEGPEPEVKVFKSGQLTSTVTVAPIRRGSDSEGEDDEDEEETGLEEMPAAEEARKMEKRRVAELEEKRAAEAAAADPATKLSKTSLRILAKTKLKIEGKKKGFGGGKGKKDAKKERGGGKGGKGGGRGKR